jgi:hypothetical protein
MTNFNFGQLVISSSNPTCKQRQNVASNRLETIQHNGSYLRVHAVSVTSPTTVYAAISFTQGGVRVVSYLAGSIQCKRKKDGYWLEYDCFIATKSVPYYLDDCPREIFLAGAATTYPVIVDADWLNSCEKSQKSRNNALALKRGAVFTYESGKPAVVLAGRNATYAVVLNKRTALFIEPFSGTTRVGDTDTVVENFLPLPPSIIPTLSEEFGYSESGELLFDLSQPVPTLKGRLAKGVKAQQLVRDQARRDQGMSDAIRHHNFAANFQSGAWLA